MRRGKRTSCCDSCRLTRRSAPKFSGSCRRCGSETEDRHAVGHAPSIWISPQGRLTGPSTSSDERECRRDERVTPSTVRLDLSLLRHRPLTTHPRKGGLSLMTNIGSSALMIGRPLALGAPAAAQQTTGNITGRIVDDQGAAVPGVTVTASNTQTGFTRTDVIGRRRYLPAERHCRSAPTTSRPSSQGFSRIESKGIVVNVGQTLDINITLKVASLQETVTVTGETPLIETRLHPRSAASSTSAGSRACRSTAGSSPTSRRRSPASASASTPTRRRARSSRRRSTAATAATSTTRSTAATTTTTRSAACSSSSRSRRSRSSTS